MKGSVGACSIISPALFLFTLPSLAQEVGDIQFKFEPGAKIYLDGDFKGETKAELGGLIIQKVPVGQHMVRVERQGLPPLEGEVMVLAGMVSLVGPIGHIWVVSDEAGVKIFLDGEFRGETSADQFGLLIQYLPTGRYKVRAVKEGFPLQEEEIELREERRFHRLKPFLRGSAGQKKSEAPGAEGKVAAKKETGPEGSPGERENSLGMRLRAVPAGEIDMDLPEGSVGADPDSLKAVRRSASSKTRKKVRARIPNAFEILVCEVKMSEFEKVTGRKPKAAPSDFRLESIPGEPFSDLPAMSVSWDEATEFCRKLSELPEEKGTGSRYRLPTEAEWALARQAAGSKFPCFSWAQRKIAKSIWELCSNFYDEAYYKDMPMVDPQGPPSGSRRVARLVHGSPDSSTGWCTFRVVAEGRHLEDWAVKKERKESFDKAVREGSRKPSAVERGLRWLARHQDPDGRWSTMDFGSHCPATGKCAGPGHGNNDVGLTGLALLAFLGWGKLPVSDYIYEDPFRPGTTISFNDVVEKGLRWLAKQQDPEGGFARQEERFMYDHAIATCAMTKGASHSGLQIYRDHAQRGIDFLVKAQNPGFAWKYSVRPGNNDTSVTGWCVKALREAEISGLRFPGTAYEGVRSWLERVTSNQGVVGYEDPGDQGSVIPDMNDKWQNHPTMTAVGLHTRVLMDKKRNDPVLRVMAQAIVKDLPAWDEKKKTVDSYYWHHGTLALREADGPRGPAWRAFKEAVLKALLKFQCGKTSCGDGSWDPSVDKWGLAAGRLYTTSINLLTLEAAAGPESQP